MYVYSCIYKCVCMYMYTHTYIPFANEMSVFSAKMTSKRDTSDPKHVLHYLSLNSGVVSQWHGLKGRKYMYVNITIIWASGNNRENSIVW